MNMAEKEKKKDKRMKLKRWILWLSSWMMDIAMFVVCCLLLVNCLLTTVVFERD